MSEPVISLVPDVPAVRRKGRGDHEAIAEAARANPGWWVKVGQRGRAWCSDGKVGRRPSLPPHLFEYRSRVVDEDGVRADKGQVWCYVRAIEET